MFNGRLAKLTAVSTLMGIVLVGVGTVTTGQTPATTVQSKVKEKAKEKVKAKAKEKGAATTPLDLNKASAEEMIEQLPGVGEATAKKIVAGRPYTKVDDLAKAGVPARTIEGIRNLVTVGRAPATATAETPAAAKAKAARKKGATPEPAASAATPLDLNKASTEAMIEHLPGVGEATAKKIVAGRPYAKVEDLAKAGVPARTIEGIRNLVTVSQAPAPAPAPTATEAAAKAKTARTKEAAPAPGSAAAKAKAAAKARLAPGEKINLNTASKEDLDKLPEIGPVRAQAIIDGRPYKTIEDVKKVKGIKEINFSKLKDVITVE